MKEDNNIKSLIAAILKLSLKLSKSQGTPKTVKKTVKAVAKPKDATKAKKAPRAVRTKIVGGGSAEFFE
jgi:hypothetical protein